MTDHPPSETPHDDILPYCNCADPENCRERVPGYACKPKRAPSETPQGSPDPWALFIADIERAVNYYAKPCLVHGVPSDSQRRTLIADIKRNIESGRAADARRIQELQAELADLRGTVIIGEENERQLRADLARCRRERDEARANAQLRDTALGEAIRRLKDSRAVDVAALWRLHDEWKRRAARLSTAEGRAAGYAALFGSECAEELASLLPSRSEGQ